MDSGTVFNMFWLRSSFSRCTSWFIIPPPGVSSDLRDIILLSDRSNIRMFVSLWSLRGRSPTVADRFSLTPPTNKLFYHCQEINIHSNTYIWLSRITNQEVKAVILKIIWWFFYKKLYKKLNHHCVLSWTFLGIQHLHCHRRSLHLVQVVDGTIQFHL